MTDQFGNGSKGYAFAAKPKLVKTNKKSNNTGDFIEYFL